MRGLVELMQHNAIEASAGLLRAQQADTVGTAGNGGYGLDAPVKGIQPQRSIGMTFEAVPIAVGAGQLTDG